MEYPIGGTGAVSDVAQEQLQQAEETPSSFCPVCSLRLEERKCKLFCPVCGYYMSCSDYY